MCNAAAKNGYLEIIQWAMANGYEWSLRICCEAAYGGHLEILKWAQSNGYNWNYLGLLFCCTKWPTGNYQMGYIQWF